MASVSQLRGMQVHAVPESERFVESSGRKLPWSYDSTPATVAGSGRREPAEKGAFGRSQRRSRTPFSRSRSRTAEPRREEDRVKAEQLAAEDAVFGSVRRAQQKEDGGKREALGEVDANTVAAGTTIPASREHAQPEPAEVVLFGFGQDRQWAAIDHYERVSGGKVLEDYDRQPPGHRYDASRSLSRASSQKSWTRETLKKMMKKKNSFAGGQHWIKVTFDSEDAANVACASGPHVIKGHLVYASMYDGRGPGRDEAIPATQAGAQITDSTLPSTFSTKLDASPNSSSTTATSATATARREQDTGLSSPSQSDPFAPRASQPTSVLSPSTPSPAPTASQQQTLRHRPSRIEGAIQIEMKPASAAILPNKPKQSWSAWLGTSYYFGIGSVVPRKEGPDGGTFDWENASVYWKFWWFVDETLRTDFCGMKGD